MAKLVCRNLEHGEYLLELNPWSALCDRSDIESYRLKLTRAGLVVYDQEQTVSGWQEGHFSIWLICNAFRRAALLLDKTVGFNLYDMNEPSREKHKDVSIWVDTDWLGFSLSAMRVRAGQDKWEDRLIGHAVLRTSSESSITSNAVWFRFVCPLENAIRFGTDLFSECQSAALERAALLGDAAGYDPFLPDDLQRLSKPTLPTKPE